MRTRVFRALAIFAGLLASVSSHALAQSANRLSTDWAYLERYRAENAALGAPQPGEQRVVFMGNSITEGWAKHFPTMFPGKQYVGRGISGQTTPQMLVRFRQDVIALRPAAVVLLAGINDIAGNTGPATLEMIQDNLVSMTELARANGIAVVLSSVLPAYDFPWRRGLEPAPKVVALNQWLAHYAATQGIVFVDYHEAAITESLTRRGRAPRSLRARQRASPASDPSASDLTRLTPPATAATRSRSGAMIRNQIGMGPLARSTASIVPHVMPNADALTSGDCLSSHAANQPPEKPPRASIVVTFAIHNGVMPASDGLSGKTRTIAL
jgi:lysophospholipase L1-like esterase